MTASFLNSLHLRLHLNVLSNSSLAKVKNPAPIIDLWVLKVNHDPAYFQKKIEKRMVPPIYILHNHIVPRIHSRVGSAV